MAKLNKPLTPDDLAAINASSQTNWVPKQPRELILPYITEMSPEEKGDIEKRREKAKEVYDGYTKVIEESKRLEDELSERCKDATVTFDKSTNMRTYDAIGRVFGRRDNKITFQMYKMAVQQLAKISGSSPEPGDF